MWLVLIAAVLFLGPSETGQVFTPPDVRVANLPYSTTLDDGEQTTHEDTEATMILERGTQLHVYVVIDADAPED